MADETGKSDVLNPYGLNPNSGKPMPWARESLAVSLLPNVTQARLYTCWAPGHEPDWAKPRQPEMRAWDPAEDERRRAAANNLGILFLGPVFGAPAALARMAGAPEPVVESMGQMGLDLAGVAGVPAARGGARAVTPTQIRPVVTAITSPRSPINTGIYVVKPSPKINRQKQDGHIANTPQNKNRKKGGKPTSTFHENVDADKITQEAWHKGKPVPGKHWVRDYDFGFSIGESPTGLPQSTVRVHLDNSGKIHGHPVGTMRK
ncbi:hypothetical protein [Delftia acidovorans]|uniref:hypothetical protein n=1 Tax=Delftia acidovorans TaxID=80866 RepID=UPI0033403FE5